jgi:hypothetical protein
MKTKLVYFVFFVALARIVIGCGDGDLPEVIPHNAPAQALKENNWKLVGIMDAQTGSLTELEPRDCEVCYTLMFDTDTTFLSSSSVKNSLCGTYTCNYKMHSFRMIGTESLLFLERGDGVLWKSILLTVNAFTLLEDELRLYYNENKNYLLFKSQYETGNTLADTRWKLIEASILKDNDYLAEVIDYSEKNIIYDFQGNDTLVVTGKTDSLFIFDYFKEGEHFYEYRELIVCTLCTPGPNLSIDKPPLGQSDGNYFALLNGEKLEIVGDTYIGGVRHENGLRDGGTLYRWGKTFIKLK